MHIFCIFICIFFEPLFIGFIIVLRNARIFKIEFMVWFPQFPLLLRSNKNCKVVKNFIIEINKRIT